MVVMKRQDGHERRGDMMNETDMKDFISREKCCGEVMIVYECSMPNVDEDAYSAICSKCGHIITIRDGQLAPEELEEHLKGTTMHGGI